MEITLKTLAALIDGEIEGDNEQKISSFAKIEEATPGSLTFLANPKYTHFIYETKATAVLVSRDFKPERPLAAALVRVDDPYKTLADLLTRVKDLIPPKRGVEQPCHIARGVDIDETCYVGAFAYIGEGARIGKNVQIYPQAYIGDGVVIGDGSIIRAGVKIYEGCVLGKRVIVHSGTVIGADGFGFAPVADGYEKIPQMGNVEIGDDVEIGANATIDRATFGSTVVGNGTKIDNLVQVGHNVRLGHDNVLCAQVGIAGSASIGNCNQFAGQVGIAGHIEIGDHNQVGAQSGIPNSIGSHRRLMGYPAIDARQFAKNLVYIKRLPSLFK